MIYRFAALYASWVFPTIIFALAMWTVWQAIRDHRWGKKR